MAHDVFISYSTQDKPAADALCAILENNGVRCWIAPRDIVAGSDWGGSIVNGIRTSRVMLLVFSTSANASNQIKREVECAASAGVTIVPLRIENILPTESFQYFLGNIHWLDALTPPLEKHLQEVVVKVKAILGAESVSSQKSSQPSLPAKAPIIQSKRGLTSPGKRTWLSVAGVVTVLAFIVVAAIYFRPHPSELAVQPSPKSTAPVGALTPTADTSNIVTSNAPVPIRFWIKQLPEVPGEDATKLFSNALGSWQAVVVTPMRKADSEAEANVIILTSSETIADAQVGPPTSESSPLTIRFGSTVSWTPHTFEAASNRMIGHILGLTYTNTPGQMMSERATLESLPLVPQPEDIKRIRQI